MNGDENRFGSGRSDRIIFRKLREKLRMVRTILLGMRLDDFIYLKQQAYMPSTIRETLTSGLSLVTPPKHGNRQSHRYHFVISGDACVSPSRILKR
jgi:hypothetical protein